MSSLLLDYCSSVESQVPLSIDGLFIPIEWTIPTCTCMNRFLLQNWKYWHLHTYFLEYNFIFENSLKMEKLRPMSSLKTHVFVTWLFPLSVSIFLLLYIYYFVIKPTSKFRQKMFFNFRFQFHNKRWSGLGTN